MAEINCDVIKDMLPLYADEVVSESSRKLIEEHLDSCSDCSEYLGQLKEKPPVIGMSAEQDDKAAFQKVRRKIRKKRILTAVIAALGSVFIFAGLFYFIYVARIYLPYEESGLYMEHGVLKTGLSPYSVRLFTLTGYPETEFIYMESTRYEQMFQEPHINTEPVLKMEYLFEYAEDPDQPAPDVPEEDKYRVKEIYYVSADTAAKLNAGKYWIDETGLSSDEISEKNASLIEELKAASRLVWKMDEQESETE